MTTWELIRSMVQKDYEFQIGRHVKGMRGYWACFIKIDLDLRMKCDECGGPFSVVWSEAGHALTPHRAVVMAARLALGEQTTVPTDEEFKL